MPIGGYIKIQGEVENTESQSSFLHLSTIRKISIVLSGILITLVVLIIVNISVIHIDGYRKTTINNNFKVQDSNNIFMQGDEILKVNNTEVNLGEDIIYKIALSNKKEVDFLIEREGEKKHISIDNLEEEKDLKTFKSALEKMDSPSVMESIKIGFNKTLNLTGDTYKQFGRMLTKDINLKNYLSGIFKTVEISTETGNIGVNFVLNLLIYIGIIFISFNSLPVPLFDGGKLWIELFQGVTRKEISRKVLMLMEMISFIAILIIIIFIVI
ncbi:M50 family metallopeptidase [Clostridium sp. ZBS15]|uniref:M50 family metallopeptidase n=1 Tax=Clostridium sp. ZBS15 TaxID=2949969 RepID=UPI00207A26BB|nr:M50 family metallopeptidase [Clostridium sp. ZBS15]